MPIQPGTFGADDLTLAFLEPIYSEDQIDYNYVYALFSFIATMEGQISVLKGEALELLDDSNSYWWAVKCIGSKEIGYIPAENIESPFERLARLNKQRNVDNQTNENLKQDIKRKDRPKLQFDRFNTHIYPDDTQEPFDTELNSENGIEIENEEILKEKKEKKKSFLGKFFKTNKKLVIETTMQKSNEDLKLDIDVGTPSGNASINILRIYPGNVILSSTFKTVSFDKTTNIKTLLTNALKKFRLSDQDVTRYYITITPLDATGKGVAASILY
jgi:hypothetical protein